jgi:hypothetical protein
MIFVWPEAIFPQKISRPNISAFTGKDFIFYI